jgi:hypothetical protein
VHCHRNPTWLNGFSHFASGEMESQCYEGMAAGYTAYGYDGLGRLGVANSNLPGTARDVQLSYGRNPAGQLASLTGNNDAYAWTGHYD